MALATPHPTEEPQTRALKMSAHETRALKMRHLWFLFSCCLLTLCDALNCSVTGENGQTTYIISDLPQDSAGSWVYTWANSTNHVIANNKQQIGGLVLKNTNTTLHTSEFIEGIVFTGFIVSTGDRYIARCQITSTENARPWKNTEFSRYTLPPAAIAAIAAMVVFVFLLLVLLVVLLYKFRDKIPSCNSRRPPGAFTLVKTADPGVSVVNE